MMIVYENGKIIAVSKHLLNSLNLSLEDISKVINKLQLETAVLSQNSIEILNTLFNINKEDLLTLKNIDIYKLEKIDTAQTIKTPETNIYETGENPVLTEDSLLQIFPQEKNETLKMPEVNIIEEKEKPIELNFEDDISECEKIFETKNKINETIKKELKIATEELGIDESLANELFEDLLTQIANNKNALFDAIKNKNYDQIHKIAHYLKGASLNLRLSNLAFIFKTIDEKAKSKTDISIIKSLTDKLYDYVSPLMKKENQNIKEETKNITIDPKIKNIVLNTIRYYLETQDEKKFQEDKKYIEKLLNLQINSINDLKQILKEK